MRKRLVSAALALLLCLSLLPTAAWAAETAFRDVSGHWAEETITAWREKGDISGYSDGTFRPNNSVTRAEFVKLLNRAIGLTAEGTISFTDVKESDWFYAEVAKAVAAGYAGGMGDDTFQPEAPITRAQAAAMLARAQKLTANESRADGFSDASAIPAWAKGSVGAVAASGYMTGYPDGSFGASGNITRAEAVVTLDRVQDVTITAAGQDRRR